MQKPRTIIVILGATGDLSKRKLIPALHILYKRGLIADCCTIIGCGRSGITAEEFRGLFDVSSEFSQLLCYHQGIEGLKRYIEEKGIVHRIIFFFALPPVVYASTARELKNEGFGEESCIIVEKPFGYDYDSARTLDRELTACFKEKQIYRIDHYLAKEAVQNILVFRFANIVFNPLWNSNYIESIQINACEDTGVGRRGVYFDSAGIIRDMIQNHLIQLLCLVTMEPPLKLDAEEIRYQKLNILKALTITECFRGQYTGYRDEKDVKNDSDTETYAELTLFINNFRWTGMPVYIRAGKALNRKGTEIGIKFKSLPPLLFNERSNLPANKIIFKIQPAEGIILDMASKVPGTDVRISNTNMNFCYRDSFSQEIPEAYQRLLMDVIRGDKTLFISSEETELSWKKIDPVMGKGEVVMYEPGTAPVLNKSVQWIDFEQYGSICQ